jgi:hypothetical protein
VKIQQTSSLTESVAAHIICAPCTPKPRDSRRLTDRLPKSICFRSRNKESCTESTVNHEPADEMFASLPFSRRE